MAHIVGTANCDSEAVTCLRSDGHWRYRRNTSQRHDVEAEARIVRGNPGYLIGEIVHEQRSGPALRTDSDAEVRYGIAGKLDDRVGLVPGRTRVRAVKSRLHGKDAHRLRVLARGAGPVLR